MAIKSPIDLTDQTLECTVKVDGNVIEDYYSLISIVVKHQVNRISTAEISFENTPNEDGKYEVSDSDDFVPGNLIEIFTGYGLEQHTSIFSGIITKQSFKVDSEFRTFNLHCTHEAIKMTFNRKEADFVEMADSDIINSIIAANGLIANVENSNYIQEILVQNASTDWDFIVSRAEFNGFLVVLNDRNTLIIGKPQLDQEPVLRLTMGESINDFSAELDAQSQMPSIESSTWDVDNQELIFEKADEPLLQNQSIISAKQLSETLGQEKQTIFSGSPMNAQALKTWADGALLKMRLTALKGMVSFQGNGLVTPGKLILFEGLGSRYNGKAFVSAVSHEISDGNWKTTVGFGLESTSIAQSTGFNAPAAAGQLPAVNGLQIATVKNISSDPKGLFRIQVVLSATNDQSGIWARVSNFYATSQAGSGFLPEIGDEVIVGFLDSNPCSPIVLGSLYSTSKPPYFSSNNDNYIKSIVTKSKLQISFDDEKKVISLATPAGNVFTLDDGNKRITLTDQNGNLLTMDANGIQISSNNEISFKAGGSINFDSAQSINLSAKMDVNVNAANIKNKASLSFTAKGEASAEISAAGQTTIKGALVNIN